MEAYTEDIEKIGTLAEDITEESMRPQEEPHSLSGSRIQVSDSTHQWISTVVLHLHHGISCETISGFHHQIYLGENTQLELE